MDNVQWQDHRGDFSSIICEVHRQVRQPPPSLSICNLGNGVRVSPWSCDGLVYAAHRPPPTTINLRESLRNRSWRLGSFVCSTVLCSLSKLLRSLKEQQDDVNESAASIQFIPQSHDLIWPGSSWTWSFNKTTTMVRTRCGFDHFLFIIQLKWMRNSWKHFGLWSF